MMTFASHGNSIEIEHRDRSPFPRNPAVSEVFALMSGGKDHIAGRRATAPTGEGARP